ncbi:MAG: hypothetical protein ABI378_12475 [Chitinophagaceae bacterium]
MPLLERVSGIFGFGGFWTLEQTMNSGTSDWNGGYQWNLLQA